MRLGVDVGGTFTDAVLLSDGEITSAKAPTTPADQSEGVGAAIEAVLAKAGAETHQIEAFAHGMTVGTNALLERRGASTALIATDGFTDLLEIARQNRPHLYDLCVDRPAPLSPPDLRIGVAERVGPDGVIDDLETDEIDRVCAEIERLDPESVAICLLFSHVDPDHEVALAAALRERFEDLHVSVSSEVLPRFREYERCSTTVLDAYLAPLLARYLGRMSERCEQLGLAAPAVMQSSGGVAPAEVAAKGGAWSVLSGPAGGAVGAGLIATASGSGNAIGFDMGGTSCDVSVIEGGEVRRTDAREFAGRPIQLPMVDVHTVGAGGGSVAWRDPGGALQVGPMSAGAEPGPACYGKGGTQPTVTDANLLLGYLDGEGELAGDLRLDRVAAERVVGELAETLELEPLETAAGIVEVANHQMLQALRVATVERGVDPRGFDLLAFGGAGPLHAAAIAAELGIERILCPRAGGVLSALGLIASPRRRDTARTMIVPLAEADSAALAKITSPLAETLHAGADDELEAVFELRYVGQAFELGVSGPLDPDPDRLAADFGTEHERRYGYRDDDAPIELVTVRVSATGPSEVPEPGAASGVDLTRSSRRGRFGGEWLEMEVIAGEPEAGLTASGPCAFELPEATLILPPEWSAEVDAHGTIVATAESESP